MNDDYGSLTDEEVLIYLLASQVAADQSDYLSAIEAFDEFMGEFFPSDDEA
jgi:hypothetical protein